MQAFRYELKVRSYECDLYGHVNNAVYLNYLEAARVEFLQALDLSLGTLQKMGFLLPIVRIEIDYLRPLFPGDLAEVSVKWVSRGRSSAEFEQVVVHKKSGKPAARARVTWVSTDLQGKPIPIPEVILTRAREYLGELPPLENKMIRKKREK